MEEITEGAPEVPTAPPEAAATETTEEPVSDDQAWGEIAAKPAEEAPPAETPPAEGEKPKDPAGADEGAEEKKEWPEAEPPKPKSMRERLIERAARQAEQAKLSPLQQQLQQQQEQLQREQTAFQQQQQELQQAIKKGDLDAYLKRTAGLTVEEYTRQKLMDAGQRDPEVERMRAELEQLKTSAAQRQQEQLQQQQELAQQQQQQQELQELRDDLATTGLPGIDKLVKLEGFTETVYRGIVENKLDWLDAATQTRQHYIQARDQLNEALGHPPSPSGAETASKSHQSGVVTETNREPSGPPTSLPQSAASEAGGTNLDDLSDDEAWEIVQRRVK